MAARSSSQFTARSTHERLAAPLVYVRGGQPYEFPLWWAVEGIA